MRYDTSISEPTFRLTNVKVEPEWVVRVSDAGARFSLQGSASTSFIGEHVAATQEQSRVEASTQSSQRKYDIVIHGATGFTGRLIAEHLDALLSSSSDAEACIRSWALSGRSASRLASIAETCKTTPGVLVHMPGDDLKEVASQCKVLIAAAGPFSRCGEAVVKACISAGTHYIDISGETTWIHEMIARYHNLAKEAGVMVIHSAAQVCAVDEINCYLLAQKLGPLKQFREYFFQYGGLTGGTFGTSVVTMKDMTEESYRIYCDPFSLGGKRRTSSYDAADCNKAEQDHLYPSVWLQPAYNGHTGARIIRRSCQLFEEQTGHSSPLVTYGENISVVIRDASSSKRAAEQAVQMAGPPQSVEAARQLASLMEDQVSNGNMPRPGEGPPSETRARYYSEVFALAEAETGKWAHIHYTGPEAYEVTAMAVVTGAMVLLEESEVIKPSLRGGVVTPAFAFHGTSWVRRLETDSFAKRDGQRMKFRYHDGRPTEDVLREAILRRSRSAVAGQAEIGKGAIKAWSS